MELLTGTSGFSYKEWKGSFYPETLRAEEMLAYYAERLGAVEINNTFYRMPSQELLGGWRARVPARFRFVIKAPQRITHRARLLDCQDSVDALWRACEALGEQLGPLLFQLPPHFRKDLARLQGFLAGLPAGSRAAFEFRHRSWLADDVFDALRGAGAALCIADADPEPPKWSRPRTGATCACGASSTRRRISTPGRSASARPPGARPSRSSSTRTAPPARGSPWTSPSASHRLRASILGPESEYPGAMDARAALRELEALGTAQNRKVYARHGVDGRPSASATPTSAS